MAKVKFGLKNAYYALATIGSDGSATYGTPVKLPGAVSISMEPAGDNNTFYADDIAYYITGGNTGYTGELELALITDDFRKDCLGEKEASTGFIVEDADGQPKQFALMFEFTTDDKAQKHVFYNCTATRPSITGQTKGESVDVSTETISLTATAIYNAKLDTNIVKAKADSSADEYADWYTAVQQPTV